MEQLAAFGWWVLGGHQPKETAPGQAPECSCGSTLESCPYRAAAARYLGPSTGPGSAA